MFSKHKIIVFFLLLIPFLIFLIFFLAFHLVFWGRIYPHIKAAGIPLAGRTKQEAEKILEKEEKWRKIKFLRLFWENNHWEIDLSQAGLVFLPEQTANKAYRLGRGGNFGQNFQKKIILWQKGENVNLDYQINENLLKEKLATISSLIFIPKIEPAISAENQQIVINPGLAGREIDFSFLLIKIQEKLSLGQPLNILLPIKINPPKVLFGQIEVAKIRAEKLLGKKLILFKEDLSFEIESERIISFLSFGGGFEKEKIATFTAQLAESLDKKPENAAFQFANGKVTVFKPGKDGIKLEKEKSVALIKEELYRLENTLEKSSRISLPTINIPPNITTESVNNLGIKELLGKGVSFFKGSLPERIHNIRLSSEKLNGLLISPHQIFSFNEAVGDISKTTGFLPAYIIKEGKTILGDGGGVCQVSTTLFRAALSSGLPIEERVAHAYRVGYYEQNSPPGFDATVYAPLADLKIKNDTPAHVLIQTIFDPLNLSLTFELYGTSDGRKAIISQPKILSQTPPPPDLYQDDPALPKGIVKQIDWSAWGANVSFDFKVEKNNQLIFSKIFNSSFRPWQAVFLKGTKE